MAVIDIQGFIDKLNNGEIDLDTWAEIVNSNNLTVTTRLNGSVPTWFGVMAALSAATGLVYTSKSAMDAAPGTKVGQAARVTEGADAGLYLWSGSAWVKTIDPLTSFDSLTINKGKDYPMKAVSRGGTAPSDVHPVWSAGLVGARLEGVEADTAFRLAYYANGNGGNYGVTVYKMPMSDLTNQTLVVTSSASPGFQFDRAAGGIQMRTGLIADGVRLTLVVDVDQLPADGEFVTSLNPTHNGFNSIISPDCYFLKSVIAENSLSINANKDYPLIAVTRGGTAPQDINPSLKACLVGAQVIDARDNYFYRLGYYGNGVLVSGEANYGVSIYRIPKDRLAEGYEQVITSYLTSPALVPDRIKGGIQTFEFACVDDPQTRMKISFDVDKLPADGTQINASSATNNGFNSIIDPSCYLVGDYSEWIEGNCLVDWDADSKKLIVAYKSGSKWYNVRYQRKSVNQTFTILGFGFDDAYKNVLNNIFPVQNTPLTSRTEAASDFIGPMIFNRVTGGDAGAPTNLYTGGSHGTENTAGDPTSEMKLLEIYVDGTRLDQTRNIHKTCKFVDILTQQDVQASNTTISKTSAAEEYVSFNISPKGVFVSKKLKALFDLQFTADNACQCYMAGMASGASYLLWGASQTARANIVDGTPISSGPKSSYPEVYGVSIKHAVAGEFNSWVDPFFGVGDRASTEASKPLYENPDGSGKIYPRLFSSAQPFSLKAGDSYEWRGGFYWGMPTNTANFDTVQQVQDGVLTVKPNGRYEVRNDASTTRKYVDSTVGPIAESVRILDRDTSNIYPDADIANAALYSGLPGRITPSSAAAPNRGIYSVYPPVSEAGSIITPSWPIEAGMGYYMGTRIGTQLRTVDIALFADWYSDHEMTTLVRSDQIGARYVGTGYSDRYAQLTAPSNAVRVRFRIDKAAGEVTSSPAISRPIVRRLTDASLIDPALTASLNQAALNVFDAAPARVTDATASFTNTLAGGALTNRPEMSQYVAYPGGSGISARMLTVDGLLARRKLTSFGAINGVYPIFDVRYVFGRLSAAITKVELGFAWFKADLTASSTPETVLEDYDNFNSPLASVETTVGQSGANADVTGPSDARYFTPFIRWTGAGIMGQTRMLVQFLDVNPHTAGGNVPIEEIVEDVVETITPDIDAKVAAGQSAVDFVPSRVVDASASFTASLVGGPITNRPALTEFTRIAGGSGIGARVATADGVIARRRLTSIGALGATIPVFDVRAIIGRWGGVSTKVEIGIAWFKNDETVSSTPETIVQSYDNFDASLAEHKFSVGQSGADAEVTGPADAKYFTPFVRWTGSGTTGNTRLLILFLDTLPQNGSGPVPAADLADLVEQVQERAYRSEIDVARIPRVTSAQAAALTISERFLHDWYFVSDGDGMTHREDLPVFNSQAWAVDMDFAGGDYLTGSVTTAPDTVTLRGRPWNDVPGLDNNYPGYLGARIKGANGRTPAIVVTNTNQWAPPQTFTRWRLVWGTEPNGDNWNLFDNMVYDDVANTWTFSNEAPFDSDTVYLFHMPHYSIERYDNKFREWMSSRLTRPTPSALDGYRIGTLPSKEIHGDKTAPAIDAYAFCVGTGPHIAVLTSGVHPDEQPGHYMFEGAVNAILSPTPLGQSLRDNFTFYLYPRINAQCMWAGYRRIDVDSMIDMNRIFGNTEYTSDVTSLYMSAWQTDLGANADAHIDFHSWPTANPEARAQIRSIWQRTDIAEETVRSPFITTLQTYGPIAFESNYTNPYTVNDAMRQLGTPKLVLTAEYIHDVDSGIDQWRGYGLDLMRSLEAVKHLF